MAPAVAGDRSPQEPTLQPEASVSTCSLGRLSKEGKRSRPCCNSWCLCLEPAVPSSATRSSPKAGRWCQTSQREIRVTLNWCYKEARAGSLSCFLSCPCIKNEEWLRRDLRCLGIRTSDSKGNIVLLVVPQPFGSEESRYPHFRSGIMLWATGHRRDVANSCFNLALYRNIFLKDKSCNLIISIWTLLVRTAFKFLKGSLLEKELKTVLAKSFILTALVMADFWLTCKFLWENNLIFFNWSM